MKTRNQAAAILFKAGWSFEEIEEVLAPKYKPPVLRNWPLGPPYEPWRTVRFEPPVTYRSTTANTLDEFKKAWKEKYGDE